MDAEQLRDYCLSKPGVEECFPFGIETNVYKVNGKIFLLFSLDKVPLQFNVKCDAVEAELLREKYSSVLPGYHMNKKLWNTVVIDGSISKNELLSFINNSYNLVLAKKKKL